MTQVPLPIALIAAVARNGVIGADNALPWRLPSDMRHFKATTMGKPLIMGRKTYDSIGRPLPGRTTIVVSRTASPASPGLLAATSLDDAIEQADAVGRALGSSEIMIAGGGTLYRALIDRAHRLYLTHVEAMPAGDTSFPAIDPLLWRVADRVSPPRADGDDISFAFVTYERL